MIDAHAPLGQDPVGRMGERHAVHAAADGDRKRGVGSKKMRQSCGDRFGVRHQNTPRIASEICGNTMIGMSTPISMKMNGHVSFRIAE